MSTTSISKNYAELAEGMGAVISRLSPTDWDRPSPCAEWSTRDVLDHLIGTQRDFLGRHGVDLPAPPDLGDPVTAWADHVTTVVRALDDPSVAAREFETPFGSMTVGAALLQFYGFDLVAHRWDIAAASDEPYRFSDAELDSLETSIAAWGDALYAEGICERGAAAPAGADRQTAVLAALGRAV